MSIFGAIRRSLERLLPQDCSVCGLGSGNAPVCPACAADLPYLDGPLCPVCALPTTGGRCGACLAAPPRFDATTAVFRYAYPVEHLVQALKYRQRLALAGWLAASLAARVGRDGIDCVLPLPLSAARMRERGFNQAQEIARPLARALGLPLLADCCSRVRDTPPQAGLPWTERQANMRQAFACRGGLTGKRIAVVDDVMTTGATLNEFARLLKRHGAARVENWVAARTLP